MTTGVRHAPPNLLSVLTMPGRGQDPWVREPGAFRILMDPSLGWPLAPFVTVFSAVEVTEETLEPVEWSAFGDVEGATRVRSEAWLVLDPRPEDSDPGLVEVVVDGFDAHPEISVVRHVGDRRPGLARRTFPPYRLAAPGITTLRVRGACRVLRIAVSSVFDHFEQEGTTVLGAPVGLLPGRYLGRDEDESQAMARVGGGAPVRFPPHEPAPSPPGVFEAMQAERARVAAIANSLREPLRALLAAPIGGHDAMAALPVVSGRPAVTRAEFQNQMTTLVAGGDLGVARWLGLADQVRDLPRVTIIVTVMGVWALRQSHPLARYAPSISRRSFVEPFFQRPGLDGIGQLADQLAANGLTPLWLFSQAWVDRQVPPAHPRPPVVLARTPPVWLRGPTEDDDVALLSIETRDVEVLGQVAVQRTGPDPAPLHRMLEGTDRLRSQLAVEGPAVNDAVTGPFGPRTYRAWQSDAFGRWSDHADLRVTEFSRIPLPRPDPMVRLLAGSPTGDAPWTPRLLVRVGLPPRAGGQAGIATVEVATDAETQVVSAPGREVVDFEMRGPSVGPAETRTASLDVSFHATGDAEVVTVTRSVPIVDPRPPPPPTPPPVLQFATRPDATGVSTVVVPLPAAPGVEAYFVDVAREGDLVAASGLQPPQNVSRDGRAQFWLQQARRRLAPAFYRLTPTPVPVAAGSYASDFAGDLAGLIAFRLVPVGTNHASPDRRDCGFAFFAVPRDVAPPQPVLLVDRAVAPPRFEVRSAPGAVRAGDVRVRALARPEADPRSGQIVVVGALVDGVARLPVPASVPAGTTVYVAEVRGEPEPGAQPSPGRWSRPSNPVHP